MQIFSEGVEFLVFIGGEQVEDVSLDTPELWDKVQSSQHWATRETYACSCSAGAARVIM